MSNSARQRLSVDARRAQLLEVGSRLFGERPYDDVWIDDVATAAGVSRGLIYHYFGSKREYLHAIVEHETRAIFAATAPDPALPPAGQLRAALRSYLRHAAARPQGYRALFRGSASADERVRELVASNLRRQEERLLAPYGGRDQASQRARLAVRGWLAFLVSIVLDWLDDPQLEEEALIDLAITALQAMLGEARAA